MKSVALLGCYCYYHPNLRFDGADVFRKSFSVKYDVNVNFEVFCIIYTNLLIFCRHDSRMNAIMLMKFWY